MVSNSIIQKIFGYEGVLADKNLRRNRKNFISTVVALTVGVVLFVSLGFLSQQASGLEKAMTIDVDATMISDYTSDPTSVLFLVVGVAVWFSQFWVQPEALTPTMASSIKGFVISSALVGCIIGGAWGGQISSAIGRKNGLIIAALLFTVSAIGSALPDKLNFLGVEMVSSLIFYRIIGGIGVGIASMLSPVYIAEVAPAHIRGKLVSFNQFAIIFGMLIVYIVNYFIARGGSSEWIDTIGWRWMFASETIPCVLFLSLLFFVPKTPRYLLLKGKDEESRKVLTNLYGEKEMEIEYKSIRKSLIEKNAPWLSFGSALIVIGILLSFFQQAVGINVVLYYAPEIFRTMGAGNDAALMQTIIVGIINLSFTVAAIMTVDRFGSKIGRASRRERVLRIV